MITNMRNKNEKGYAVLELLFYISIFGVLSIVVINAMIVMTRSLKETSLQAEYTQDGTILERISREIRNAADITSVSANDLVLSTASGASFKSVEFKLVGSNIQLWDSGSNIGNLNPASTTITALTFTQITTAQGKGVKIAFTVRSTNDPLARTQDFYDTVTLRGTYK
jgi:Tfp pilus assembly protein PilE